MWHVKTGKPIPAGWRVFWHLPARNCVNPAHMICEPTAQQGQKVAASGKLKGNIRRITANRKTGRLRAGWTQKPVKRCESRRNPALLWPSVGLQPADDQPHSQSPGRILQPVGGMFTGLMARAA